MLVQWMTEAPCQACIITTDSHINHSTNGWKLKRLHLCACLLFLYECDVLTERIDVFPDCQGEAAASVVNSEEDHGHVLRGAHASPH